MTARAQIHRLVDALPDDVLDTVEHMLLEFAPIINDQGAVTTAKVPTAGRTPGAPADAAEERLHSFFRRFKGRSLADELIAERRDPLKRRMHLLSLLEQVSDTNRHGEVQTGPPVGGEAW